MVEVLIIGLIAIGVLYYLYYTLKDYMGNENNQERFLRKEQQPVLIEPKEPTLQEKIQSSEFGILSGILGYVANADGEICMLEKKVAESMLEEMAQEMGKLGDPQEIFEILKEIFFCPNKDIQMLTQAFCNLTKGEYKKKLKVVEFCFVLGYADGILNDETKEAIIDVAALLELDNLDFNGLYDDFAQENHLTLSLDEAKEIFGDLSQKSLEERYTELIAQTKQNLTDDEKLQKFDGKKQLLALQKIHSAYELLKKH